MDLRLLWDKLFQNTDRIKTTIHFRAADTFYYFLDANEKECVYWSVLMFLRMAFTIRLGTATTTTTTTTGDATIPWISLLTVCITAIILPQILSLIWTVLQNTLTHSEREEGRIRTRIIQSHAWLRSLFICHYVGFGYSLLVVYTLFFLVLFSLIVFECKRDLPAMNTYTTN